MIAYPILGAMALGVVLFVAHEMRGRTPVSQVQAQAQL
jgi:hypothetical protein